MANYIPYTQDNMFLWYEGSDPDRYTPFNGTNLNLPLKQLEKNDEKLDQTIKDFESGNSTASHLKTNDFDVSGTFNFNGAILKSGSEKITLRNKDDENKIIIDSYKIDTIKIKLNGLNLDYNDETMTLKDDDGNLKKLKIHTLNVEEIKFNDIDSKLEVIEDTVDEEKVDYLDFKVGDNYDNSFIRTGAFYALKSYYNFGSQDLQDAIVYDDSNDGDTPNTFLFYADGEVDNSTVMAGDFKTVGEDIAEYYSADEKYEVGTILEVAENLNVNGTLYNGGKLLGVISEKPGTILGKGNYDNPALIALKGKVKVKIIGEAKKGQYIIADSNGKGKAIDNILTMPENLRLIGVALENGTDEVLVKI